MKKKTCFVIMPIRTVGSPEHAHFRAIYNQIRPTLERQGYLVIRADDVQKSGAITKDIVTRLGDSDLVVADLTDLNPNVFYELGVRHALRGKGTVMIIDDARTTEIPFDLGAYRVIRFTGDLTGIETLISALDKFISEIGDSETSRDNPVHDWFPILPVNALETASQSSDAPLRRTIKELQERIDQYEKAYGGKMSRSLIDSSPVSLIQSAMADAQEGLLPANVLEEARAAFDKRDIIVLLKKVQILIERDVRLPSMVFLTLIRYASVLDLAIVVRALFEQALQFYPSDSNLRRNYLAQLAHSEVPDDRAKARKEIAADIALEITAVEIKATEIDRLGNNLSSVGILLDAYHRDALHPDALRITDKMIELFPDSTQMIRAHARALEKVGEAKRALTTYRRAIFAPDVDETSAIWLGSELHNRSRHADAAEAYAFACLLDPADGNGFSHLADEISICLSRHSVARSENASRKIADSITVINLIDATQCALSCPNVDSEIADRLRRAVDRIEIQFPTDGAAIPRLRRLEIAKDIYGSLKTGLTSQDSDFDVNEPNRVLVTDSESQPPVPQHRAYGSVHGGSAQTRDKPA